VHGVGLAVVDKDPEGVLLGNGVGRTGVQGGGFRPHGPCRKAPR
jgi:hypothetical protein